MTWLNDNWIWLGAAAAVLVVVYGATRIAEKRKQRAEAERMIVALMGMLAAFEEIVHQTLGSRYSAEDRRKIAAGMAAVVVTEGIPLDRLAADKVLFGKVLIASIQFLTQQHQIS